MYKMDKYREIVRNTLEKRFAKEFPHGLESVSEYQLLDWELWPVCITIHRKYFWLVSTHRHLCECVCVQIVGDPVLCIFFSPLPSQFPLLFHPVSTYI